MKLKLRKENMLYLEDVLLDVYFGLPSPQLEGDPRLRDIIDAIQRKVHDADV